MKKILFAVISLMLIFAMLMSAACAEDEAYINVFRTAECIPEMHSAVDGCKWGRFSILLEGNIIDQQEIFYKWGKVRYMYNTVYIPMEGASQLEKEQVLAQMYNTFEDVLNEDFVGAYHLIYNSFVVFSIYYLDLDVKENVRKLGEYGIVDYGVDYLSAKKCEEVWLEAGYAKE